ncbi:unnamed protein product [Oikopleura dioica]|uniref:Uncharacterized protein n=1 Tax=Oikopleura dioica TaxID=34765 RepID=E4YDH2_OIKDI|nr:unnamed protein product [Oikopleura dioica]
MSTSDGEAAKTDEIETPKTENQENEDLMVIDSQIEEPKIEKEVESEPDLEPEPELEPEPVEPEIEASSEAEPKPEAEVEPKVEPEPEIEAEPEVEPEPRAKLVREVRVCSKTADLNLEIRNDANLEVKTITESNYLRL